MFVLLSSDDLVLLDRDDLVPKVGQAVLPRLDAYLSRLSRVLALSFLVAVYNSCPGMSRFGLAQKDRGTHVKEIACMISG